MTSFRDSLQKSSGDVKWGTNSLAPKRLMSSSCDSSKVMFHFLIAWSNSQSCSGYCASNHSEVSFEFPPVLVPWQPPCYAFEPLALFQGNSEAVIHFKCHLKSVCLNYLSLKVIILCMHVNKNRNMTENLKTLQPLKNLTWHEALIIDWFFFVHRKAASPAN